MKLFDLGDIGLEYFTSSIGQADYLGFGMSEAVGEGRVYTFLPEGADPHAISLEKGTLKSLDASTRSIRNTLASSLANLAAELNYTILSELQWFENSERSKAIDLYAKDPYRIIFADSTRKVTTEPSSGAPSKFGVYGLLPSTSMTPDNVDCLLSDSGFLFLAFSVLTRNPDVNKLQALDVVSPDFLKDVGRSADYAIMDAYDLESYVVWIREGRASLALF